MSIQPTIADAMPWLQTPCLAMLLLAGHMNS
jgi:hypothetical protein